MSSPARAECYDTPAQQRDDSTTFKFMVAKVSPSGWNNASKKVGAARAGEAAKRQGAGR